MEPSEMTAHNHPPHCCCDPDNPIRKLTCPLCPDHGELAQLPEPQCTSCHTVAGHPHTEYCQAYRRAVDGLHPEQTAAGDNPLSCPLCGCKLTDSTPNCPACEQRHKLHAPDQGGAPDECHACGWSSLYQGTCTNCGTDHRQDP